MNYDSKISKELGLTSLQVKNTIALLEEGATIPFIARYRKEMTNALDEVQIGDIRDLHKQYLELDKRKEAIIKSVNEQEKLTPELIQQINEAETMAALEDIYLPYKPKRRTKASIAREKGLQELSDQLLQQTNQDVIELASTFIDVEKGVASAEDALLGARDILAELFAENAAVRSSIRELFHKKGNFKSTVIVGKEESAQKYKDYFDWKEPVNSVASHRLLAMRRAEKEEFLKLEVQVEEEDAIEILKKEFKKGESKAADQIELAIIDSYKRLIKPSIETEVRVLTRQKADDEAIRVFTENARQLLLAAPMGQKRLMAIDPGFRTGCKIVCLDEQGKLLLNETIYPHTGTGKLVEAERIIKELVVKYSIEAIAIGNGTAGRETETFIRKIVPASLTVVMVNENGASIYSASPAAREEFPDHDITVRGAVSIGRRLMDPLAELVKIDPKSIGVGQYQHDVDQAKLQSSLDDTVSSCVNAVGVSLNTASKQILSYVSGLGPVLAQNIIKYRDEHGPFQSRNDLKKVPRLGDKAFEQAAGFLRIMEAENPLDRSAVHPERYSLVEKIAEDSKTSVTELLKNDKLRKSIDLKAYVNDSVGLPTLNDIIAELAKPGRDPREKFEAFAFTEGVNSINDLKVGMTLPGLVTNITNFGAFVDIGVHQDGLVHLSQLSNRYVKDANEIVKVNQQVEVRVTEIDVSRKRIALSMKTEESVKRAPKQVQKRAKEKISNDNMQSKLAALKAKFN